MNDATALEPVAVRRTRADDIDAHTELLGDWDLHYDQLDCGAFEGTFTDVRWPGMQLFMETTTRRVRQRGSLPAASFSVGTMLAGEGVVSVNGRRSGAGNLIAGDASELDVCTPAGCTLAGLVVSAQALVEAIEDMSDLTPLLGPGAMLPMTAPSQWLMPWRSLLSSSLQLAVDTPWRLQDPVVRRRLQDDLLVHVVDAMADAQRDDKPQCADNRRRKRIVDRACDLMLSQPDEPPSLFDVCRQVGASPRKLGYCFQEVLGLSPARYLKAMRLNAVRRELGRGDRSGMSVYDAAVRWGFWHFGHFSADYKKQFSELPSETLNRSRSRVRGPGGIFDGLSAHRRDARARQPSSGERLFV